MPSNHNKKEKGVGIDKSIDFLKQEFAATIRSRTGSLSEKATLLRFKPGTKAFHRSYEKLVGKAKQMLRIFHKSILKFLPKKGLRIGIFDDSSIKKTGKNFPKQQIHHEHTNNTFYSGMKLFSTAIYQCGKLATISSEIVGKEENKLEVASDMVETLVHRFDVDIILFDSWYCKSLVIEKILEHQLLFISRLRCDSKVVLDKKTKTRLDELAKSIPHKQYTKIKINGKSYWIYDATLNFEAYGKLRVIFSKEGQYEEPIFLTTNAEKFAAKFIVKLYLRRFLIEVYFKDAKQFLHLETFFCRPEEKWDLHLLLTNILHWCIQQKKSISKTIRRVRENINQCLLFINENPLLCKFFEGLKKTCQT
ncbi:MAG: transposase [Patescibacteria group bacterium]